MIQSIRPPQYRQLQNVVYFVGGIITAWITASAFARSAMQRPERFSQLLQANAGICATCIAQANQPQVANVHLKGLIASLGDVSAVAPELALGAESAKSGQLGDAFGANLLGLPEAPGLNAPWNRGQVGQTWTLGAQIETGLSPSLTGFGKPGDISPYFATSYYDSTRGGILRDRASYFTSPWMQPIRPSDFGIY